MPKILVLGSHAQSLIIFRFDMLRALAQTHTVVACVPLAPDPDIMQNVLQKLQSIGVSLRTVNLSRTGLNPLFDLRTIYALYKIFKEERPDQIFSYTVKPVIFGSIAAKLANVPQIYSMITGLGSYFIHQNFKARVVRGLMSGLYKFALQLNTKVFFQNTDDIADFAKHNIFNDPLRCVLTNGSGVNLEYFRPMPIPNNVCFLLTARLIVDKGVMEYLNAAQLIKKQYPHVEFLLAGWYDNKDQAISPQVIEQYVAGGTIKYLGKLEDVRPALAQSSIFVLPSYREGTPKTILEAMACGRAIIATNVPGCRETVIPGENGYLVPARDIASLRAAMEEFIINPTMIYQMGQRSRELAVTKYDVNQVNQVIFNAMDQ